MSRNRILIVDDEPAIREMVAVALELADFDVLEADNAQRAHEYIVDERPDLVLLDWMLPSVSGIELARRLKREDATAEVPIIMLTAKSEEDNKIQGLDVGADDYITKPFSTRELISRIKAVLRRTSVVAAEKAIDVEGLCLDPVSHRISANGDPVDMGPTEYRLLEFFM
ncbi:MAG: response regulator, partial [Alloalcanivorax venustensis]